MKQTMIQKLLQRASTKVRAFTLFFLLLATASAWAEALTGFVTVSQQGTATARFAFSDHFYRVDWSGINTSETSSVKLFNNPNYDELLAQTNGDDKSVISLYANASNFTKWGHITVLTPGQSSDGYTSFEKLATGASTGSKKKVCTVTCLAAKVTWNWSNDYTTCTATFTCAEDASLTKTVNATVTTSGSRHTATATFNGISNSNSKIIWNGGGSGTSADPYQVASASDLAILATDVNGGTDYSQKFFLQTADITLSSAWTPIGSSSHPFKGHYNGGGCKISGLSVSGSYQYAGLFGYTRAVGYSPTNQLCELKNIVVEGCNIDVSGTSGTYAGGIVGYASDDSRIINCRVSGTVTATTGAGGIAGQLWTTPSGHISKMSQCFADVTVAANNKGKLIGYVSTAVSETALNSKTSYYHADGSCTAFGNNVDITYSVPLYTVTASSSVTVAETNATLTHGGKHFFASGATVTLGHGDRTGYEFGGYVSSDVTITDGTFTMPSKDVNITATWTPSANIALAANQVDGNYWTTFYCGHAGYKIADEENAWAYTAEYNGVNSQLTLHKLGKVIPAGTAVILVGEDNEISMSASTEAAENDVENDLHGVNVRTLKSTLGTGTFYVLSKKTSDFGFFEYTGEYMPARKAYLLIDGGAALAKGLTMVFDDETTGITTTNFTNYTDYNNAWYDMQGRKLDGKPTVKGLYIHNGRKEVLK